MTPEPPAHRINLDARAAELREKLHRARQNSQQRQLTSQGQSSQDTKATVPASGPLSAMAFKPGPTAAPQDKPQLHSLEDDIAALIQSISSSVPDTPTMESGSADGKGSHVQPTAPTGPVTAPEQLGPSSKPVPKASALTTADSNGPATQRPDLSSQQRSMLLNEPLSQVPAQQPSGDVKTDSSSQVPKPASSPNPTSAPATNGKASINAAPSNGNVMATAGSAYSKPSTLVVTDQGSAYPTTRTEPDPPRVRPTATTDKKNAEKPRINIKPITGRSSPNIPNRDEGAPARIIRPIVPGESPKDTLARLLSMDPELKDFLEMTDYYNAETRTRRLDRFRRAKELAEQKRKIEEEERKLREEEELEMSLHRSSTAVRLPSTFSTPAIPETATLPTPVTPLLQNAPVRPKDTPGISPGSLKRPLDEESTGDRLEKVPRIDTPPCARSVERRPSDSERQNIPTGPRRNAHPDMDEARRDSRDDRNEPRRRSLSPVERSRFRHHAGDNRRGGFSYRGGDRYHEADRRLSYPIPVDLGRKGDTRFFIVKSFNDENVRRCMEDGLWTTQVQNEKMLSDAFAQCKNVILFFSVNKSKAFQGYARMASAPSPDIPKPSFVKGIHWDTSDAFRVEWLSKTTVDFWRVGHLKNSFNDNEAVLVGKDGQEIEPGCGTDLLRIMEDFAIARERDADRDGDRYHHERGGHGGGYGGYHYRHQSGQKRGGFHSNRR
ncbi:hypothetical protein VTJ49DRAFT_1492 [Mycothermus thermophilus]|uniref:YTH domain-containing protein n=1 Tax=Humicola insolens TaxID=85995 RepID=A0ABR3VC75_HUMIN